MNKQAKISLTFEVIAMIAVALVIGIFIGIKMFPQNNSTQCPTNTNSGIDINYLNSSITSYQTCVYGEISAQMTGYANQITNQCPISEGSTCVVSQQALSTAVLNMNNFGKNANTYISNYCNTYINSLFWSHPYK